MGQRPLINFLKNNSNQPTSEEVEHEGQVEGEIAEETAEEEKPDPVESFKQDYARKLGWTSKEEWEKAGRDAAMWRDHNDFLDNSPTYFQNLRKKVKNQEHRIQQNAAAAAAALDEERRRGREEAEREAREAAAAGDPDRAAAAVKKAAEGPPAETVAWIGRNPWFNQDMGARALAAATVERLAATGASVSDQLTAAEKEVRKRYPEHFAEDDDDMDLPDFITKPVRQQERQEQEPPQREVRMSESKRVAAAANTPGGSRVRETKSNREKTFRDIPKQDQDLYNKHFARKFQGRGLTAEQAQEKYAKTYFGTKDN